MPAPGRPTLKLKLSTSAIQPAPQPPSGTSTPKIHLKLSSGGAVASKISSPVVVPDSPAASIKKGIRIRKPSAKKAKGDALEDSSPPPAAKGKKRTKSHGEDEDKDVKLPKLKKLKLQVKRPSSVPIIRTKLKGKPPFHPPGQGYDSELEDREIDPHIEEEFVLRMMPGEDCEYIRNAIEEKKMGLKVNEGGADFRIKFFTRDGRRAAVYVRGHTYAAVLVDLPCVTEGMKSWDRRGWYKTADISQMLLVFTRVDSDEAALTAPFPHPISEKSFQWPHGLTPPMRFARDRRFRKRVSNKKIEAVEEEVDRLLALDQECEPGGSKWELLDLDLLNRESSGGPSEADQLQGDEYEEPDAEGVADEDDYFMGREPDAEAEEEDEEDGDDLEADLEMAMMMENQIAQAPTVETITAPSSAETPLTTTTTTTTAAPTPAEEPEDSGDDSSDGDDDGLDLDDEGQQAAKQLQEEIADIQAAIKNKETEMGRLNNPILKQKLGKQIESLNADLQLKKTASGLGIED
ncbi:MAG: hypothetical protein M1829_002394 [Trizodia sp. TS-e1964]|nr:MAG: hypothetical protein M1829_002394 [Trizodia sp. TS-e1964]